MENSHSDFLTWWFEYHYRIGLHPFSICRVIRVITSDPNKGMTTSHSPAMPTSSWMVVRTDVRCSCEEGHCRSDPVQVRSIIMGNVWFNNALICFNLISTNGQIGPMSGNRQWGSVYSGRSCLWLLAAARKLTTSWEILLWMTPSEAPKALQASECSELLDPMRASNWISAQH